MERGDKRFGSDLRFSTEGRNTGTPSDGRNHKGHQHAEYEYRCTEYQYRCTEYEYRCTEYEYRCTEYEYR
ncbi:MAG: hypothetical protein ACK5ZC_10120 [Pirellulaceae bacterium]